MSTYLKYVKFFETDGIETLALSIRSCIVVFVTLLMITAVSQAETNTGGKEAILLAHPKQTGMGQPFLVRLTSAQAFDRISVRWMDREFVPSVSVWNRRHVAIAMLGTDILTTKPGRQKLLIRAWAGEKETVRQRWILIVAGTYPRQELNLPSKMVTPPTVELERIKAERRPW